MVHSKALAIRLKKDLEEAIAETSLDVLKHLREGNMRDAYKAHMSNEYWFTTYMKHFGMHSSAMPEYLKAMEHPPGTEQPEPTKHDDLKRKVRERARQRLQDYE